MDPVGTTRARRLSLSRRRADSPKGFGRFRRGGVVATRGNSQPSAAWKPRSRIAGTGSYLPATVVSNADLASFLDTNDAWIRERTGIAERRIAGEDEATSDLAVVAARRALAAAGLHASDLDLIVVGTITPDGPMPACAVRVQTKLGLDKVPSFDVSAACAGFLYGMVIADQFIKTGAAKNVLVVGAELLSRVVDWSDRTTAVLFGDGAGAVVLTGAERGGLISARLASEGGLADALGIPAGGTFEPLTVRGMSGHRDKMKMVGQDVFRAAIRGLAEIGEQVVREAGLSMSDVDWFVPHQSNMRILSAVADRWQVGLDRFILMLEATGNTSSASVPIGLDEGLRDGRIRCGQKILMFALGAGISYGAVLLEVG